ncbi:MAG: glycoside hydrolase family protein [Pseudomonadota bacterium]
MASPMRTSRAGRDLIQRFEGFHPRAVPLGRDRWMIGYGHTRAARAGLSITREDAALLLKEYDLRTVEETIARAVFVPLAQHEFDALAAFIFNIGPRAFMTSAVRDCLNAGDRLTAADAMEAWRLAKFGDRLVLADALVRRRAAEKALFLTPATSAVLPSARARPRRDETRWPAYQVAADLSGTAEALAAEAPRPAAEEAPPSPIATLTPTAPPEAAREVAERLTRILGEPVKPASPAAPDPRDPTPADITKAISALAEPEVAVPGDLPPLEDPLPQTQAAIDDLAPVEIDEAQVDAAIAAANGEGRSVIGPVFHGLIGAGGVALASYGLVRLLAPQAVQAVGRSGAALDYADTGIFLLGSLLTILAVYFGGKSVIRGRD